VGWDRNGTAGLVLERMVMMTLGPRVIFLCHVRLISGITCNLFFKWTNVSCNCLLYTHSPFLWSYHAVLEEIKSVEMYEARCLRIQVNAFLCHFLLEKEI
jgi:hypothetical protein